MEVLMDHTMTNEIDFIDEKINLNRIKKLINYFGKLKKPQTISFDFSGALTKGELIFNLEYIFLKNRSSRLLKIFLTG